MATELHPARKVFRRFLLACLCFSFVFLFTIIFLRILYKDKNLPTDMAVFFLKADVVQHQVWAFASDDAQDMRIAESLLKLGYISRIYSDAGFKMMRETSERGYAPASSRLAYYDRMMNGALLADNSLMPPAPQVMINLEDVPVQGQ